VAQLLRSYILLLGFGFLGFQLPQALEADPVILLVGDEVELGLTALTNGDNHTFTFILSLLPRFAKECRDIPQRATRTERIYLVVNDPKTLENPLGLQSLLFPRHTQNGIWLDRQLVDTLF
jgi:hypothetical protein